MSARVALIPPGVEPATFTARGSCRSAWALHRAWPEAELKIVPDAGHNANGARRAGAAARRSRPLTTAPWCVVSEPGNQTELLNACDKFAVL